ncbi:MAG: type II toxin-antitoxin system PemK/MazF family toxin [Pyrinomonadaceae bacterium]
MERLVSPRRGEVYLVQFDPTVGSEIRKTRPALIIQNDTGNEFSPITIVAAITSKVSDHRYPTDVLISAGEGGLTQTSTVLLNQIRSIDHSRLLKKLGKVEAATLRKVDISIQISLGLRPY